MVQAKTINIPSVAASMRMNGLEPPLDKHR